MTLKEAKMTIYANVIYACEEAGFQPMTIKLVKDACDTVIALAEQADTPQTEEIYPLTIVFDRYNGTYSKGCYTAWNMYFDEIPQDIDSDDISCYDFWHSYNGVVGLGRTPNEAIEDLRQKLSKQTECSWK